MTVDGFSALDGGRALGAALAARLEVGAVADGAPSSAQVGGIGGSMAQSSLRRRRFARSWTTHSLPRREHRRHGCPSQAAFARWHSKHARLRDNLLITRALPSEARDCSTEEATHDLEAE